jgi:predicted class III extradiol MEMO1 family dioxygenase
LFANQISSSDSSAIQVNDAVNISGTLSADVLDINEISSGDSTAIQINDAVNISGTLDVQGNKIIGVQDPTDSQDAATKNYVDAQVVASSSFTVVGDDSTGTVFNTGETIKFEGQGTASVTVTGDTVFINSTASIPPITFVGDDSTGTAVNVGETIKIAGTQNITTAVSGDTLTISGPDLSTYVTASSSTAFTNKTGNISQWTNDSAYITNSPMTIVGDDSTGVTLNTGETIKVAGTQNITTAVSGDTLTITGPDLSAYITNSPMTIVGDDSTGVTLNTGETIKIAGAQNITTAVSGDTLTITGSKSIDVNEIAPVIHLPYRSMMM